MKTKTKKNYCYTGLGFPVLLDEVEMALLGDEWHLKIDVRKIANIVIKELAVKDTPLTGNEVHFIRTHFGMSLRDFANHVAHGTHIVVKKWEDKGNKPTKMNPNTEFVIRNYIIEETSSKTEKQATYYTRTVEARKFYNQKNTDNPMPQIHCA